MPSGSGYRHARQKEREALIKQEEVAIQTAAAEQQQRDNRGHLVTKLHTATNTLIHCEASASPQKRRRVEGAMADELNDTLSRNSRALNSPA